MISNKQFLGLQLFNGSIISAAWLDQIEALLSIALLSISIAISIYKLKEVINKKKKSPSNNKG